VGGLSGFSEFHSCARAVNQAEQNFLTRFSFGDGAILDVGANLGIISLLMARRFPGRPIHAFEPNPSALLSLRANFVRNKCNHAQAYAAAIAAHDGEILFQVDPVNRATTHIAGANEDGTASPQIARVPCLTLDSFIETRNIDEVCLLKVDVEGYEELVFRGAEQILKKQLIETVYYEVCPSLAARAGFAPESSSSILLESGYHLHVLDNNGRLEPADLSRIKKIALENWVATRTVAA
jgi:FkbM family methyltransferase